jgi:hypothetical protein
MDALKPSLTADTATRPSSKATGAQPKGARPRKPPAWADWIATLTERREQIDQIVTMLEAGNVDGALRAVGLDPSRFVDLDKAIAEAFIARKAKGAFLTNDPFEVVDTSGLTDADWAEINKI